MLTASSFTKCSLQPVGDVKYNNQHRLKGLLLPTWSGKPIVEDHRPPVIRDVMASEVQHCEWPGFADLVIYKDWLGRVTEVLNAITLKLADNGVVEIDQRLATHVDDEEGPFAVGDLAFSTKGSLRTGTWVYGQYNANTPPLGTVVRTRDVEMHVIWLERRIGSKDETEPPPSLERVEIESSDFHIYDRSVRPAGASSNDFPSVSNSEIDVQLGQRVRFHDLTAACAKYDGSAGRSKLTRLDRKDTLGYDLNVFDVVRLETEATVQWQDLSITRERSIDLVPDHDIDDEHAAWPGEVAHSLDSTPVAGLQGITQPRGVCVVQSVEAEQRMAKVMWCPDACLQFADVDWGEEQTTVKAPVSAVVGRARGPVEEVSLYDLDTPASLNVRRGDIVLIAERRWRLPNLVTGPRGADWLGEVVDTKLDGTLTIRTGAARRVQDVNLQREEVVVVVRSDDTTAVDGWDDGEDEEIDWDDERSQRSGELSDLEADARYEDENGDPIDVDDAEGEEWESDVGAGWEDTEMPDAPPLEPDASGGNMAESSSHPADDSAPQASAPPEQYAILSTPVPSTHRFASQPPASTPQHTKRTHKEHQILAAPSSLPPGVFVRTWESRLDLLRILFIGPVETPYAHAPFVIDLHLPPTFPTSPPHAHFHSWPADPRLGGSVGRVNPNLYDDGTVCLSLLGTWESARAQEAWSPTRSTLLQLLVSLQGLVLVPRPYFNEAGYEPLAGLESARRPAALYNERAFLRARGFVLAALRPEAQGGPAPGTEGLEDVLRFVYRDPAGPRALAAVVAQIEGLLERSEGEGGGDGGEDGDGDGDGNANGTATANPDSNPNPDPDTEPLSKGVCIPLRRVLARLREV